MAAGVILIALGLAKMGGVIKYILSGAHSQPMLAPGKTDLLDDVGDDNLVASLDATISPATEVLATRVTGSPRVAERWAPAIAVRGQSSRLFANIGGE